MHNQVVIFRFNLEFPFSNETWPRKWHQVKHKSCRQVSHEWEQSNICWKCTHWLYSHSSHFELKSLSGCKTWPGRGSKTQPCAATVVYQDTHHTNIKHQTDIYNFTDFPTEKCLRNQQISRIQRHRGSRLKVINLLHCSLLLGGSCSIRGQFVLTITWFSLFQMDK